MASRQSHGFTVLPLFDRAGPFFAVVHVLIEQFASDLVPEISEHHSHPPSWTASRGPQMSVRSRHHQSIADCRRRKAGIWGGDERGLLSWCEAGYGSRAGVQFGNATGGSDHGIETRIAGHCAHCGASRGRDDIPPIDRLNAVAGKCGTLRRAPRLCRRQR